jgi:hypothetical protein
MVGGKLEDNILTRYAVKKAEQFINTTVTR